MATFRDIDYGFRYGSKKAIDAAGLKEGTFNIATDDKEIYVDIGGTRISTKVIYVFNTENSIKAIEEPIANKLYFAADTLRIWTFNANFLRWEQVGGPISEIEDTITEFEEDINQSIEDLTQVVEAIKSFEIVILQSYETLPEEGQSNVVYFVPQSNSDEDTLYDEYVWIQYPGYYEKIGISRADLTNYYTKSEVDSIENGVYSALGFTKQDTYASEFLSVDTRLNALESTSADISKIGTMESQIGAYADPEDSSFVSIEDRFVSIEGNVSTTQTDITEIKAKFGAYADSTDTGFESVESRLTTLETASGGDSGRISELIERMDTAEGNISSINSTLDDLDFGEEVDDEEEEG